MFDLKIFYKTYLHDYHKFKSISLYSILEKLPEYEVEFFGNVLDEDDSLAYSLTLKSEVRLNYIHCIETFFEIFFALKLSAKNNFDDQNILFNLSNSDWRSNHKAIIKIAEGEMSLDFLKEELNFHGHKITIGHYIFYYGLVGRALTSELSTKISKSIDAIQHGIKIIAKDFGDRDEYNSYKHGLRIIPALSELALADAKTKEIQKRWDLKNSMSFFCKTDVSKKIEIKTKNFATMRDLTMTRFCSNMISSMILTRRFSFYKKDLVKKNEQFKIGFFGKEEIDACNKADVELQDLTFTLSKT